MWSAIAISTLILQPLFFFRRQLFQLTAYIPFDLPDFHYPLAAFIERSFEQRIWPFWNPLDYCGVPLHADIQAQLFYPPAWLAILADEISGHGHLFYYLEWLVALHVIIGGLAAYHLLRHWQCPVLSSLLGATVFEIGPFFVSQAQHLGSICTAAWFPVILLCLTRLAETFSPRRVSQLALAVAMSVVSGFPATEAVVLGLSALYCAALVVFRWAKPRLLLEFAGAGLLGVGVTAIQLIPTFQLSRLSVASLRYQWLGAGGGLPWQSLVSFVRPNYYGIFTPWDSARFQLPYNFTYLYTFCGYVTVILLVGALFLVRRHKPLLLSLLLLAVSTTWMLGEHTPVYPRILRLLPHVIQNGLYPETALLGFCLFAAMSAALVSSQIEGHVPTVIVILLVAVNSWSLIRFGANKPFNAFPGGSEHADMLDWTESGRSVPVALQKLTYSAAPPSRIELLSRIGPLEEEKPVLAGLYSAAGDNPFLLLRYYALRRLFSDDVPWSRIQFPRTLDLPWFRALDIGYVLEDSTAPPRDLPGSRYEALPFSSVHVYKVWNPLPRFYLESRVLRVRSDQEALDKIRNQSFDPAAASIVEGLDDSWTPSQNATGTVKIVRYEANRLELDVAATGRVFLATSESWYPGWTATVNGKAMKILPTNVAFRGLPLDAGENHVTMQYFPNYWTLSIGVTAVALLLVVAGLLLPNLFNVGDRPKAL